MRGSLLYMTQSLLFVTFLVAFACGQGTQSSSSTGDFLSTPGDIYVIGMFKIFEPDGTTCSNDVSVNSVMYAEAVRWYFEKLSESGDYPLAIGFEAYKTCQLDTLAAAESIELVNRILQSTDGAEQTLIAGVIGPEYSTEAAVVAPILTAVDPEQRLVQVGFSATAASLQDHQKHPNFLSVVQDNGIEIETMVKTMLELEWNRIAIIYEDTLLGNEAYSSITEQANLAGICIVMAANIDITQGVNLARVSEILDQIILGTSEHSSVEGFVFFGSTVTADLLFSSIENRGIKNAPIALLSESMELDTTVFRDGAGRVDSKSKGLFAVAPPYRIIEEFQSHWISIFSNASTYNKAVTEHPWLHDVYRQIRGCTGMCNFTEMTKTDVEAVFPSQPLYVQYAIFAAHAYALAMSNVQSQFCGVSVGLCQDMKSNYKPELLRNEMNGMTLDFSRDFTFRLQSLATVTSITLSGDNGPLTAEPSYQVFNFRQTDQQTSNFGFVKIGDLNGNVLTLNHDEIRDYSDSETETRWPNVRKAQCSIGQRCAECIPRDLPERFVLVEGDVYVVGAISVYDRSSSEECGTIRTINGYQIVEALKFAVAKANGKTGVFTNLFNNLKVGLIVVNTCNNQIVAQRTMYILQKYGLTLQNGQHLDLTGKILGFVGDVGSSISIAIAQALGRLRFVQISFASTSPLLSDRDAYPYFMRVVTPDDAQAKVMIDVVKKLGGNYIQVLYNRGAYGEGGLAKVLEAADQNEVCVAAQIEVVEEDANYFAYYEQLRSTPHAKIVIAFVRSHVIRPLMKAINEVMIQGEFVFIGSEAWAKNPDVLVDDVGQNLLGSFSVVLELAQSSELHTYITNLQPAGFTENPWSKHYLEAKLNCFYPDSFDKSQPNKCEDVPDFKTDPDFTISPWVSSSYYATISLLQGAGNHLKGECGDSDSLCENYAKNIDDLIEKLKEVKLDLHGLGTRLSVFNENGDGNVGYILYNIQKETDNPQELRYTRVGQYPTQGNPTFASDQIVSPTSDRVVSRCPNEQTCSVCFPPETNNQTQIMEDKESSGTTTIVLGALLGVALLAILVLVILLVMKYRASSADRSNDDYITANDVYLHPMPAFDRPPTVGSHQYTTTDFGENFDYLKAEEMDPDI